MEVNTSPQPISASEPPTKLQSGSNSVNNHKGNFPIILGILVLLIVVAGGAYYLGTQRSKTVSLHQTPTTIPQDTVHLSPTTSPTQTTVDTTNLKTSSDTKVFPLTTFKGYNYKFTWNASSNGVVQLIKSQIGSDKITIIKELNLGVATHTDNGYLQIITTPPQSNKVLLQQGFEGTGGIAKLLVNVETGEVKRHGQWPADDKEYNAIDLPFFNIEQRVWAYSSKSDDANKVVRETLYTFDLVSEVKKEVMVLDPDKTFECKQEYATQHIYRYIDSKTLEVSICNTQKQVIDKKIIILE